jgi:cysteine desulfurase
MEKHIYLDNSSTTITDREVIMEMTPCFANFYGNASSFHSFGIQAKNILENSRVKISSYLNANAEEIIFTGSGTEANNIAILGILNALGKKGHIITSKIEHHSVLNVFKHLENSGYEVTYLNVDKNGIISIDELSKSIKENTLFISVMYVNNEVGSIEPIKEISALISKINQNRSDKIYFHTDAVQAAGKMPIDVKALGIDLLSLSAHKFNGPKGIGVLYIKNGINIEPIMFGGHHENALRPGTENIPYIAGLAKALELSAENMKENTKIVSVLNEKLKNGILKLIPQVSVNGNSDNCLPYVLNISFNYIEGEALLLKLDMAGIAVSTGSACTSGSLGSSHVLAAMGVEPISAQGAVRFSFGHHNTQQDIDYVLEVLPKIVEGLRAMSPVWNNLK